MVDVHNESINELSIKSNELHNNFHQLIKEKTSTIKSVVIKNWRYKNSRLLSLMDLLIKDFYIFENCSVDKESNELYMREPSREITLTDTRTEYKIKCIFIRDKNEYGEEKYAPSCAEFYRNGKKEYCLTTGRSLGDINITAWLDIRERAKQWTEYLNILQGVIELYYNEYIDKTTKTLDSLQSF